MLWDRFFLLNHMLLIDIRNVCRGFLSGLIGINRVSRSHIVPVLLIYDGMKVSRESAVHSPLIHTSGFFFNISQRGHVNINHGSKCDIIIQNFRQRNFKCVFNYYLYDWNIAQASTPNKPLRKKTFHKISIRYNLFLISPGYI